jgi:hypothetical protein
MHLGLEKQVVRQEVARADLTSRAMNAAIKGTLFNECA